MSYLDKFQHADDVVGHLNTLVPSLPDPLLQTKYVGFVAIVAVTVYELAIKNIFIDFGTKKHKVLGTFTESFFNRLNGRIRLKEIKENISRFGERYRIRFERRLHTRTTNFLAANRRDIVSSYGNLITWRNDFAHEGRTSTNATYLEAAQSYEDGKEIIHCLAETMTR